MHRTAILLMSGLLLLATEAIAQQAFAPQTPEDAYTSRQLIAWSQLQTPQPAPQPAPPKDKQIPQPQQPQEQEPTPPADPNSQQRPIQTCGGIHLQESNR
jgi:hypothetical protein